jgi:CRP-like cAMP-binding protein
MPVLINTETFIIFSIYPAHGNVFIRRNCARVSTPKNNIMSHQSLPLPEKKKLLQSLSLFAETPESILDELAPLMQEIEVAEGTDIFKEDEPGDCMYIIHTGEIQIHRRNTALATLHPRQVLGELALLDAETRSATATARTHAVLFKIEQEPFYKLIASRPEVARGFIEILAGRLRRLNEKTVYNSL